MTALNPTNVPSRPLPGLPEQVSTRIVFFIIGVGGAAWAPLVPFAKNRTGLNDGQLGLLLLCLGAGSILAMPIAGILATRFGCRRVIVVASGLIGLTLPMLATATNLPLLVTALFVFGAGIGSVDCVVNIQAVIVERASGRTLMSGFHGLFSVGGMVGAGGVSALLSLGISPLLATGCVVVTIIGAIVYAAPRLLPYGGTGDGPAFAIPRGPVLFVSLLCFIVFLTEGSILDWSAIFLTSERGLAPARAGLGYTVFSFAMMVGRFMGDFIVQRLGGVRILVVGGLCAAVGLTVATVVPSWQAGLLGYALVGVGCSNIVPVLFSATGRQTVMPEQLAVPAISTIGYAGILAGPALIGFMAQATSLSTAFLVLALLLVGVAAGGHRLPQ